MSPHWEKNMIKKMLLALSVIALAGTGALAQQPGIKRTPLQKVDFPDGYSTITVSAELAPGASAGRHTHPGTEIGYVLDGEVDLMVQGQETKHLKAGDSWQIAPEVPHDAKAIGDKPLKFIGIYIVDKTKPLATPAPEK
jgi:quercetin dioxygenase-like cupin family protein